MSIKQPAFMLIALSAGFTTTGNVESAPSHEGELFRRLQNLCHEDELSWLLIYSQKQAPANTAESAGISRNKHREDNIINLHANELDIRNEKEKKSDGLLSIMV